MQCRRGRIKGDGGLFRIEGLHLDAESLALGPAACGGRVNGTATALVDRHAHSATPRSRSYVRRGAFLPIALQSLSSLPMTITSWWCVGMSSEIHDEPSWCSVRKIGTSARCGDGPKRQNRRQDFCRRGRFRERQTGSNASINRSAQTS